MTNKESFIQNAFRSIVANDNISDEKARLLSENLYESIKLIKKIDDAKIVINYSGLNIIRIGSRVSVWFDGRIYFFAYNNKVSKPFSVCQSKEQILKDFHNIEDDASL